MTTTSPNTPRREAFAARVATQRPEAKEQPGYCAVPNRYGRTHGIAVTNPDGTVRTICGRNIRVKADAWAGESPYRTGWDYEIDCSHCRRVTR